MQIIESLTQLIVDTETFEAQLNATAQNLSTCGKVRHSVRGRMNDCGMDIAHFSSVFCSAHTEATAWVIDDVEIHSQTMGNWERAMELSARKRDSLAGRREEESRRGLAVAYKALLFFLRAFQDSAYATLVEVTGGRAPAYPSMSMCLSKRRNGPAFKVIKDIDGYEAWFNRMRTWRNRIKSGVGLGLAGPQTNVGVVFVELTDDNAQTVTTETIHLRDLIEGVRYSHQLLSSIDRLATTS